MVNIQTLAHAHLRWPYMLRKNSMKIFFKYKKESTYHILHPIRCTLSTQKTGQKSLCALQGEDQLERAGGHQLCKERKFTYLANQSLHLLCPQHSHASITSCAPLHIIKQKKQNLSCSLIPRQDQTAPPAMFRPSHQRFRKVLCF